MSTGPRRLGKYELQERLGRGGTAEVWKALDTQLERYVAIKILHTELRTDTDFMNRFVREARAIAALHHPNIVQIHDFQIVPASSEEGQLAYMVMNYIEGQTLAQYIFHTSRQGNFPSPADVVHLFSSVGRAIDYAHQRGMVHRDLKPANILLDKRNTTRHPMGEPILTDFGIVKLLGSASNTLSGSLLGTPHYMSPEQAQGQPGDEKSDIYSLGVILYEIFTGVRPFQGDSAVTIILQHISTMPTPPNLINPNIPPAVVEVILRCLAKSPAARFPNAGSVIAALSTAFGFSPTPNFNSQPPSQNESDFRSSTRQGLTSISSHHSVSQTPQFGPVAGTQKNEQWVPPTGTPAKAPSEKLPVANSNLSSQTSLPPTTGTSTPRLPTFTPVFPQPVSQVLPVTPSAPSLPPSVAPKKRRKGLVIGLTAVLLVVLLVAGLGTFALLNRPEGSPPTTENQSVGTALFINSGSADGASTPGFEDELQMNLHTIAAPAPGKTYYAWLLSDETVNPVQSLLLGKFTATSGNADFFHRHDQQYTNLLATYSRLLITEEDNNANPVSPSSDRHTWRYSAEIPQKLNNGVHPTSILRNIRSLLCDNSSRLSGGYNNRFLRNMRQVLTLANSARDAWDKKDVVAIRKEVVSMLDYIDGVKEVAKDVKSGQPVQIDDPTLADTPLFNPSQSQGDSSYLTLLGGTLSDIMNAPDATTAMIGFATQASNALPAVQDQLDHAHTDAKQLISLTDAQLLQSTSSDLLNDLLKQMQYAYNGQIDSSSSTQQSGAVFINTTIQRLAAFDVKPFNG